MSIPRDLAKQLTRRFAGKRCFPKSDTPEGKAALAALFDAFQKYCVDETHARHVAEDLTVETEFCPTASEIYRVALSTRPRIESRHEKCPHCQGTGWLERTVKRGGLPGVTHALTATVVDPCGCRVDISAYVAEGLEL